MKPSGLTSLCARCGHPRPYDPQSLSQLCQGCTRMLAFGGDDTFTAGNTIAVDYEPQSLNLSSDNNIYHQQTQAALPTTTYQSGQQPIAVPPLSVNPARLLSQQQAMQPSPSLKRKHSAVEGDLEQHPNKRFDGRTDDSFASFTQHRAWPPTFGDHQPSDVVQDGGEESGDEFVDAPESQDGEIAGLVEEAGKGSEGYGGNEVAAADEEDAWGDEEAVGAADGAPGSRRGEGDYQDHQAGEHDPEGGNQGGSDIAAGAPADAGGTTTQDRHDSSEPAREIEDGGEALQRKEDAQEEEEPAAAEDDDLFKATFGKSSANVPKTDNDNDADSDIQELHPNDFDQTTFIHTLHTSSKQPQTTTTLTKKTTKPFQRAHLTNTFLPLALPRHAGTNYKKQRTFHLAASEYIPRLPLATHRYWIGVLKIGVPPRASSQREANFTWMKGSRVTTVETVWRNYCAGAAEEEDGVVLCVGYERPGLGVRMEGLDYYNDHRVIFRALRTSHPDAKGRALCEELVQIVPQDTQQGEGKEVEVIEID